jgi:hypothetical protein
LYHRIGNFFIGIAPILVISALLYFLASYFVPDMLAEITYEISLVNTQMGIVEALTHLVNAVLIFFSYYTLGDWWIFVILGSFLALHMTLSPADIKNAKGGLMVPLLVIFAFDALTYFCVSANLLYATTSIFIELGGYLTTFLMMGLIVSLFAVIVSFLWRKIFFR